MNLFEEDSIAHMLGAGRFYILNDEVERGINCGQTDCTICPLDDSGACVEVLSEYFKKFFPEMTL